MKHMKFRLTLLLTLLGPHAALALEDGMRSMPKITEKKIYIVPTKEQGEKLLEDRGYGDQEPNVRMMNLMMVGGSGMEGMSMDSMKADGSPEGAEKMKMASPSSPSSASSHDVYHFETEIKPSPPQVGNNTLEFSVSKNGKPANGLKIKSQVSMSSMDMGTEEPPVKERSPGKYQIKVPFAMQGPWAVKLILPDGTEKVFDFNVGKTKKNGAQK